MSSMDEEIYMDARIRRPETVGLIDKDKEGDGKRYKAVGGYIWKYAERNDDLLASQY